MSDAVGKAGESRRWAAAARRAACAGLALAGLVACTEAPGRAPAPHVFVLLVDALRWDALGVNGQPLPITPHVDALATEGASLGAFAHSTWTKPSVATLFTSSYPTQHALSRVGSRRGRQFVSDVLPDSWLTLAERFQHAGYATGAVVNQVHLHPRFGFAQGFDEYVWSRGRHAFQLNQRFYDWLDRAPADRPLFAYVHYLDAHWPYVHSPEAFAGGEAPPLPAPFPARGRNADRWLARLGERGLAEEALRALRHRYHAEVAWVDHAIGELVAELRRRGLYDGAIVVVTSDHGEAFGEHGKLQHGFAPFEELMAIPLVVRLPERLRGALDGPPSLAGLVDLAPTRLDLAGVELDAGLQGRSLAAVARGEAEPIDAVFAETGRTRAVRTATHKLIRVVNGNLIFHDLVADPGEERAIPCAGPVCEQLLERLLGFAAEVEATRGEVLVEAVLDEEDVEALEALGYL